MKGVKIGIIQLRDKLSPKSEISRQARFIKKRLKGTSNLFIINDHPDIALNTGADGVHLGQDDVSLTKARQILGNKKIIGISCHNLSQAIAAQAQGADYISLGPIFRTQTKPGSRAIGLRALKRIKEKIDIPFFAIGGINLKNLDKLIARGIKRVAICALIAKSPQPAEIVKKIIKKIAK